MAVVTCKYHPQIPARWRCESCQINYCPSCITVNGQRAPDCPICKSELTSLGSANLIKPFWTRLREFFLYPLHPAPLMVMFGLSVIAFLIAQIPGWFIQTDFLLWRVHRYDLFSLPFVFVYLKYAQSVLEDTAHGHLKPTPLSSEKLTENGMIIVKMMLLFFAFSLIQFATLDLFGQFGKHIVQIILVFATPAAIMVLAMEDKLASAINPATVGSLMLRIGAPYLLLFALIYFLIQAKNFMIGMVSGVFSPALTIAFFEFFSMYFYLIVANMMGYLLYQHHEELGFSIDVEVEVYPEKKKTKTSPVQEVSPELRAVEILIHEGKTEEAVRQLQGVIRNSPTDLEARERLLKLLRLTGDMAAFREQGQSYISYLISDNKYAQAAKVYQGCIEFDKTFKPEKAGERVELGKLFRHNGQPKLAMAILNNLHKDFPNYDNVPQAYLMVAQMLCEQFNEDARAKQVLKFVLENYPSHPMTEAVRDYLKIVEDVSNR
ncbi:MAG: tetratricopeptide repeat protein [Gammaproteobacteria bacterium]|nr:tetratricopeptide repeat protein [Gammaproteobacteria bacterium]